MFLLPNLASWRRRRDAAPKTAFELTELTDLAYIKSSRSSYDTRTTSEEPTVSSESPVSAMRPPNVPSAMEEVLAMPELLEAILLHLPLSQILMTAQLVSPFFHETITDSPMLQQALFFMPASMDKPYLSKPNPMLTHGANSRFIDERENRYLGTEDTKWPSDGAFKQLNWEEWTRKHRKYTVRGASWRRMLVVQPPIQELEFLSREGSWKIKNETGIRMGQLENTYSDDWARFWITKDGLGRIDLTP